jgi:alkylation response protein AidB-like acyl-CoA dehydrogenase
MLECALAGVPPVFNMVGLVLTGGAVLRFGTPEQQQRWLPDILAGRSFWAQGYSEPHAGSDLAALSTRARRDGDDYIVTGRKTWTSLGFWADWIFCLVRTGEAARGGAGISFLCIDLASPGITVRPIIAIDGQPHLAEVTFDNVRVPAANLIGEEGQGWSYSKQLLSNERIWYAHIEEKRQAAGRMPRRYRDLDEALARMKSENSYLTDDQARHLTAHGISQNEDGSYSWKFDNYLRVWPPLDLTPTQVADLWASISCPTLLCYGENSWASNPEKDGRARHFKAARTVSFPDAGHWLHHDRFEMFMETVEGFLA